MAASGYEFYLLVLKVSLTSKRCSRVRDTFKHTKIKFVFPRGHVISSIVLLTRERYFQAREDKIHIPARPCNMLYISINELFILIFSLAYF